MGLVFLSSRSGHDEEAGRAPDGRTSNDARSAASRSCGWCRGPGDINANGHIFGGWVLSPDGHRRRHRRRARGGRAGRDGGDRGDGVHRADPAARPRSRSTPRVERIGRTSIAIRIEVIASRDRGTREVKVTEGLFTFVALDENHRPRPVKRAPDAVDSSRDRRSAAPRGRSRGTPDPPERACHRARRAAAPGWSPSLKREPPLSNSIRRRWSLVTTSS